MNKDDSITFYKNPKIDFLFGYFGDLPVSTKQDKFKPIEVVEIDTDGKEEILNNFYMKKPPKDSIQSFENYIKELASENFNDNNRIKKPAFIQVYLSISITEKRFKEVDVDNLAKSVLDGLNGVAYDDDSQITSLIVKKHIHPMKQNGIMIGISELTENNKGLIEDIKLMQNTPWN